MRALAKSLVKPVAEPSILADYRTQGVKGLGKAVRLSWLYRLASVGIGLGENAKRIVACRDRHHGERCFILGNGPSLNLCDLTLLKNETTFGVNAIYLNEEKMGFSPTYYVVEDVLVAGDRADEIVAWRGPREKFFGNYLEPFLGQDRSALWLNVVSRYDEYSGFPHFSENAAMRLWVGGTVTYLCLQLAFYMGFRDVYLVGFDHQYVIPEDHRVDGVRITSTTDDPNHFHPDYFGKGYRWHDPRVDRMERAFERAREHFARAGRLVCNATVGGRLDVFPRVSYDGLFAPPTDEDAPCV